MNNEGHLFDLLPAYALGCLEEDERLRVDGHLRACEVCRSELLAYRNVVNELPQAARQFTPPSGLKARTLGKASKRHDLAPSSSKTTWRQQLSQWFPSLSPAWSIASLALVVLLGASNLALWQRIRAVENVNQNTLMTIVLQNTEFSPQATGMLVLSRDGEHGTLVVDGLSPLDAAHQYQLWLIRDGKRTNGGVFSVSSEGYASIWVGSPQPLASYTSFGVTIEPEGGSPGPTGNKVLGGGL
jgi:anti-sigma-K factor RskA